MNVRANTIFILSLIIAPSAQAIIYGSNTSISRQGAQISFPQTDTDNTILGFTATQSGVGFESMATTCTYNGLLPLSGPLNLKGGTLYLQEDLFLSEGTTFSSSAIIDAQYHTVFFQGKNRLTVPDFLQDTSMLRGVMSTGPGMGTSNANVLVDWSPDGKYLAVGWGNNGAIGFYQYVNNQLRLMATSNQFSFITDMLWWPIEGESYYLVVASAALVGSPQNLYLLQIKTQASSLVLNTLASYSLSTTLHAMSWSYSGSFLVTYQQPATPSVVMYQFDGSTLAPVASDSSIPSTGADNGYRVTAWNNGGDYFALYKGTIPSAAYIYHFDESIPSMTMVKTQAFADQINYLSWSKTSSLLALTFASGTYPVQVWDYQSGPNTLTLTTSLSGFSAAVTNCEWSPTGSYLAVGMSATSSTLNVYSFNSSTNQLTLMPTATGPSNTIERLRWHKNGYDIAAAELATPLVAGVFSLLEPFSITFKNTTLSLSKDVTYNCPVVFVGENVIEADGHNIEFGERGNLILWTSAQVLIRNATFPHLKSENIRVIDDFGRPTFSNVNLSLDGDYIQDFGDYYFGDTIISGNASYIFLNSSLTIKSGSTLYFDYGMTFSYNGYFGLHVIFTDKSSILYLNNSSVFANSYDLYLVGGQIILEGACSFMATNSIRIGLNGVPIYNSLLRVLPESGIYVKGGSVVYGNL